MTNEEIEEQYKELVDIIKDIEQILISQKTTFKIHNKRLNDLRKVFLAITELKNLQIKSIPAKIPLKYEDDLQGESE